MDTTKYENKMIYPSKPKKPFLSHNNHTSADAKEYAKLLEIWEHEMECYRFAIREYHIESVRLEQKFKEDALKEVGLENHPKANKAYSMAWNKGSSGFTSVFEELEDIADLILNDD